MAAKKKGRKSGSEYASVSDIFKAEVSGKLSDLKEMETPYGTLAKARELIELAGKKVSKDFLELMTAKMPASAPSNYQAGAVGQTISAFVGLSPGKTQHPVVRVPVEAVKLKANTPVKIKIEAERIVITWA